VLYGEFSQDDDELDPHFEISTVNPTICVTGIHRSAENCWAPSSEDTTMGEWRAGLGIMIDY